MSCFNLYKNAGHTLFNLECTSFEGGGGGVQDISSKTISSKSHFVYRTFRLKDISSKGHFV